MANEFSAQRDHLDQMLHYILQQQGMIQDVSSLHDLKEVIREAIRRAERLEIQVTAFEASETVNSRRAQQAEQQLAQARANEAAWEETHQKGMADLRALVLRKHQQVMQARELLEDAVTHMMLTRTTEAEVYLKIRAFLAGKADG